MGNIWRPWFICSEILIYLNCFGMNSRSASELLIVLTLMVGLSTTQAVTTLPYLIFLMVFILFIVFGKYGWLEMANYFILLLSLTNLLLSLLIFFTSEWFKVGYTKHQHPPSSLAPLSFWLDDSPSIFSFFIKIILKKYIKYHKSQRKKNIYPNRTRVK